MEFLSLVWASTKYEPIWSLLAAHRVKKKYSTYVARHDTLVAVQFVVVYYWTDPIRILLTDGRTSGSMKTMTAVSYVVLIRGV
jgi:hypothetical protein